MTIPQFQENHSEEWRRFTETPLYRALLATLEAASPARVERLPGDIVAGGTVFCAEAQGWEKATRLLREGLMVLKPLEPVEPDYSEPEPI